jgi:hypothetical protein
MEVVGSSPTGLFTFVPPPGKSRFTLEEIIDLVNDALAKRDFILVQAGKQWIWIPTDYWSDPKIFRRRPPLVESEHLWKFKKHELVSTRVLVPHLSRKDFDEFEKPRTTGAVWYREVQNELWIMGTAGYVRRVCDKIQNLEALREYKAKK